MSKKMIEIPEDFIRDLADYNLTMKTKVERNFPQLFEQKLEPGLYRDEQGAPYILCRDKDSDWRLVTLDGLKGPRYGRVFFAESREDELESLRQIMSKLRRVE